jgi:UV DNA damage endonuclease
MLTLLRLPPQQNRDAVMILHMGGIFGDKAATLARFKDNYTKRLTPSIKARLVLENDDMGWSVHDLLPVCEDLNIPLVLDYHHHNIVFDPDQVREGTKDISAPELMARITATWTRKNITQKMHYSEPCPSAVTPRDRRKHSPRVATLPPCPPTMDLMIEAKDKEQAVFELMRTFKLPGFELINNVIPHEREDESRDPVKRKKPRKSKGRGKKKEVGGDEDDGDDDYDIVKEGKEVAEEDRSMGGSMRRVYWPPGMEEWLKPKKRETAVTKRKAGEVDEEE